MLTEGLHLLGRAHIGKTPFSLIFADRIRTREAFDDLMRRNREGFAQEKGIILVVDDLWGAQTERSAHAIVPVSSVLEFTDAGFIPRWAEVRRLLGLAGRAPSEMSMLAEATVGFRNLFNEHKPFPRGQKGFELFRQAYPDLAHLGNATLYRAKADALAT